VRHRTMREDTHFAPPKPRGRWPRPCCPFPGRHAGGLNQRQGQSGGVRRGQGRRQACRSLCRHQHRP
jgi:hypothetical protein